MENLANPVAIHPKNGTFWQPFFWAVEMDMSEQLRGQACSQGKDAKNTTESNH